MPGSVRAWLVIGAMVVTVALAQMPVVAAPTDPTVFRITPVAGADTLVTASQIADTSIATDGTTTLVTFNFGARVSGDGGKTFTSLDPRIVFPSDAFFCCGSRVLYEPSRRLFLWAIVYGPDPYFVRVGVAPAALAAKGRFAYWDFHGTDIKGADPGWSLLYPQMGASANYLYLTGLYGLSTAADPKGAVIFRMPLDQLADGAPTLALATFPMPFPEATRAGLQSAKAITPVQGSSTTMYFGQNVSPTQLDLTVWPETATPSVVTVAHATTVSPAGYGCTAPSGRDLCFGIDGRLRSGWVGGGAVGFAWTAGAGGASGMLYPYVQLIRIDEATRAVIEQPLFSSDSAAFIYPSVARNARGDLALAATIVGPKRAPSVIGFMRDDVSGPTQWTQLTLRENALSPTSSSWGQNQTVVPASPDATTWLAATATLQAKPSVPGGAAPTPFSGEAVVEVDVVSFGRERDAGGQPAAPSASPSPAAPSTSVSPAPSPTPPPSPSAPPAPSPSASPTPGGRCSVVTGTVGQRVAAFWQCVDSLAVSDHLVAEDLGQWARNVIELDPGACISVSDFRSSAGAMQSALDIASAGVSPAPPKSADVEQRIAAFWKKVDALGPLDYLAAGDLGQWALNVIDRDPSRRIRVDDFRTSTAGMQAAFDRARAAGAACRSG